MGKTLFLIVAMSHCMLICKLAYSQNAGIDKVFDFPSQYISKVQHKFSRLDEQLTRQTVQYLQRSARKEKKLARKLSKIDSSVAQKIFGNVQEKYVKLSANIKDTARVFDTGISGEYLPYVDSIRTSFSFLQQNDSLFLSSPDERGKLQASLTQVNQLQHKFQQTEQVKTFIQQRNQQIREALNKYTKLPKGISDCFTDFNKEAWYYGQQVREYKDILKDPDRMVKKGLTLLNKLPAFSQFIQQHSELASLFRLPGNYGTPQSLPGLQTRAQVQQQIQTQLANAGPNAQQYLEQNLQAAQAQLSQLKDKINKQVGSSGDMDIPDFKPNSQKTKTFWKRLEYGTNIQSAKSNYFLPTTTDLGISVGYKLNDKSTIGVGASYKMGWGQDIHHISITSEGLGLRSFLDMKLKGSFYASGGFEYNYQPINGTPAISVTTDMNEWKQSGLIGVSKIISIKSKLFKKTRLQLLWDFLSYHQVPRTQPVKFRLGYNF